MGKDRERGQRGSGAKISLELFGIIKFCKTMSSCSQTDEQESDDEELKAT